ncbi:lipid-A-disaccharide synthase [Legionella micdadei]|uniref:Lipid-A-disaccharide synthase n=1 Tax=Legionella micdadei TaxID=451 RepID=A0A098GF10_LEGMI|nr:lipid-A-disaccharide synthase [Legionella micdadei]ARG97463.1 lipid-A-disaccharide synthase [Legionella micdadei]ARH00229.1 lipid-A-disaccharide synthase [Legionella micdadei]KTD28356.1 lipid-A-disaccharide synthase [Legionella micdadei]NSL16983.1 lipid-A-disaccharide synthase [Legionella micdadei]CEG61054.1 Lipid-A-disaccharide synthase 1 [Legionella micdadei]
MPETKRLVIIAGEESGDIHAASLVHQLKTVHKSLEISGIGGRHMQEAGVHLISDLARYGTTGLTEVLRNLLIIKKAFNAIKIHLSNNKPDLLILVDFPGFNLRLVKFAKELGIRILYYISPQIWAWKANRIELIRAYVDRMAVILPFEKAIYQRANIPVSFVGHPLVEKIPTCDDAASARTKFELPTDKRLIAMLPGSRRNEIERHMPILLAAAEKLNEKLSDLHFVIPIAGTLEPSIVKNYFSKSKIGISFTLGHASEVVACSDCAVVASGTASLECALLEKPMCIIYKGSLLSFIAAMKVIKVKYLGLCNLLQNEMIVPELLQYDCNVTELTRSLFELLTDQEMSERMQRRLRQLKLSLSTGQADCTIAELVNSELKLADKKPRAEKDSS